MKKKESKQVTQPKQYSKWTCLLIFATGLLALTALMANLLGLLGSRPASVTSLSQSQKIVSNNTQGSATSERERSAALTKMHSEAERDAAFTLGLWHGLACWPLVYLWLASAEKLVDRIFGKRLDYFSPPRPWAGKWGVYLLCLAAAIALFRYAWLPIVDVIWNALGGTVVDYGKYTGRRRGQGRGDPHANGILVSSLVVLFALSYFVKDGLGQKTKKR